jgi:hypothetical protein
MRKIIRLGVNQSSGLEWENRLSSGLMLSLSKHEAALTPMFNKGATPCPKSNCLSMRRIFSAKG